MIQKHKKNFQEPLEQENEKKLNENSFWFSFLKNQKPFKSNNDYKTIFKSFVFDTPRHAYFSYSRAKIKKNKLFLPFLNFFLTEKFFVFRREERGLRENFLPNLAQLLRWRGTYFGLRAILNLFTNLPNVRIYRKKERKKLKCFMNW